MPTKVLGTDSMLRFQYFLALQLGMTRGELIRRMSAHEFAGWQAYYRRQHREQEEAAADAKGKADAQRLSRQLGGVR